MITASRAIAVLLATACMAATFAAPADAASPAWAPLIASGPTVMPPTQNEVQRVWVDAEGGTFTLSFEAQTTAPIDFDAAASEVEAALEGLSTIGGAGGGVTVSGGPGNKNGDHPYIVSFDSGSLALTNVAEMTTASAGLTGGGNHNTVLTTTVPGGAGTTQIAVYAQNIGGAESSAGATATVKLPDGVTTTGTLLPSGSWSCPGLVPSQPEFTCGYSAKVSPGMIASALRVPVTATSVATSGIVEAEVEGGGATKAGTFDMPLEIGPIPAGPGIQSFTAGAYDEDGAVDRRAGAHPANATTGIIVNSKRNFRGELVPAAEPKDIFVDIPPGFLANPVAVPQCSDAADVQTGECPKETMVGVARPIIENLAGGIASEEHVHNIEAPFGSPAKVKFSVGLGSVLVNVIGALRSDEDYGVSFGSPNTVQLASVFGVFFDFWGAPADPSHDKLRGGPSAAADTALTTLATDCGEEALVTPRVTLRLNTWQFPNDVAHSSVDIPAVTDCESLEFKADFTFQPKEASADSPASFATNLTVPSGGLTDPKERMTPTQRTTVVDLPKGVALNPSAADGLGACSTEQIGLRGTDFPVPNRIRFDKTHARCPDSSKIGTVEVKTALLAETLHGAMYLAEQESGNPFGSLFAVYLVIDNPERGIIVKLPGKIQPDPLTGQIRAVFDDIPQLPFSSLKLNFKGGSRSPLATPTTCGKFVTNTTNTPWSAPESGPPFVTEDSFTIDSGPNGTPCANTPSERPFALGLSAGSVNPVAGGHSPFTIRLTRPDGAQELDTLDIVTPPGFTASLKGVPYCSGDQIAAAKRRATGKAEQTDPSCPAASQIGTTLTAAGAGSNPFYTPGKLYLAGPYKGAPLSAVAITPAVAGPFDLGNVVVQSALAVDPATAQITAKTDAIPQLLKGVPLRIRDVRIALDRENWALNPTSCNPSAVSVKARGNSGATTTLGNHFQVKGCENLGFAPKLTASLKGGTKRSDHPAFTSTLTYPKGAYANIATISVALPHSEFLEQSHIRTICTRVQFAANACPKGSIYGFAEAFSPLLDEPLRGNVYLRSSSNDLPDLVVALRGPASQPIAIDLAGRIDSVNGGIRTSFDVVPDAPVSRFVLKMQGGKRGLLVNSRNLCARGKPQRMTVRMVGHNGKRANQFPALRNGCAKKGKRKARK